MQREAYEAHALWRSLDVLRESYENVRSGPDDAARHKLESIGAFITYLDQFREDDGLLVQDQHMQQVYSHVNNISTQMTAVVAENPNWGALDPCVAQIAPAMQNLAQFPKPSADSATAAAKRAATMFRNRLDTIAEEFEQEIATLRNKVVHTENMRADREAALSADIDTLRARLQDNEEQATTHIARLQKQIDDQRLTFESEENARSESFKAEAEAREQSAEDRLADVHAHADRIIEVLRTHEKTAEALVDSTARNAIAGDYGAWAQTQGKSAFWWTIAAIGIGLATAAGLLWALSTASATAISLTIYKTAITFVGLIVAGYAARQAAEHRREERVAKRLHLDLAALEPFLKQVEDPKELRTEVARRVFAPESDRGDHHAPRGGFRRGFTFQEVLDLVKLSRDGQ